jgi:hypothetical protein
MPVARIDFSNLPVFLNSFPGATSISGIEVGLFRRYFSKLLRYRQNQIGFVREVRSFQGDGAFHGMIAAHKYLSSRVIGEDALEKSERGVDLFLASSTFLWGLHGDYGIFDGIGHGQEPVSRRHYSDEILGPIEFPCGIFIALDGSYMADWYYQNSLMRVSLGLPDTAMALIWGRNHSWRSERVNAGAPFYSILQDTLSAGITRSSRRNILGDPTLLERYISPVTGLVAAKVGGGVVLNWNANTQASSGFRIYRADSVNPSEWSFVASVPAGATSWTGIPANPSVNAYMIKAVSVASSGSGSYSVLSLGSVAPNTIVFP